MAPKRAGLGSLAVRLPPQGFALTRWREMFRIRPAPSVSYITQMTGRSTPATLSCIGVVVASWAVGRAACHCCAPTSVSAQRPPHTIPQSHAAVVTSLGRPR